MYLRCEPTKVGSLFICYCRGRVPRPGGKKLIFCIIFSESVIARLRDGKPVPYTLSSNPYSRYFFRYRPV